MASRIGLAGIGLVLVLFTQGCVGLLSRESLGLAWKGEFLTSAAPNASAEKDLPPREAAKLCITTANKLADKGHETQAILQFEKARNYDPDHPDISPRLAVLYDRQQQDAKALVEYQKALEARPRDARLHSDFGYFHYQRGNYADAEKSLRKAVDLDAKNSRAWGNLGMTLGMLNRPQESFEAFLKSANGNKAVAHHDFAVILAKQKKNEEAKAELKKALQIDPNLKMARAVLEELENPRPVAPPDAKRSPRGDPMKGGRPKPTSEPTSGLFPPLNEKQTVEQRAEVGPQPREKPREVLDDVLDSPHEPRASLMRSKSLEAPEVPRPDALRLR